MELAPIVIFSYDRPDHLSKVLTALAKNDLADHSVLYIYCDGAKETASDEQRERIAHNRQVARAATGFKELHVIERPKNIGLKDNIVGAVTEIVNQYGSIITLEDDIITSVGFLKYMNDALELYKDEDKVMHVCGYMFPVKHEKWLPETFFHPVPYPGGGWGTWARAWNNYNDNIQEHYIYWSQDWKRFNAWGPDLQNQLTMNYTGQLQTWFIRWFATMHKIGGLTLYPYHSLTTNIGFDGSGENCVALKNNKFWIKDVAESILVTRRKIATSRIAVHEMYVFWSGYWWSKRHREEWKRRVMEILNFEKK